MRKIDWELRTTSKRIIKLRCGEFFDVIEGSIETVRSTEGSM
jgi:hypothetical protein